MKRAGKTRLEPYSRFEDLAKRLVSVPKKEIIKKAREQDHKKNGNSSGR